MKELSEFALMSDLAKFAKLMPDADECKKSLEFGYRLVQLTTEATAPRPPAPRTDAPRPRLQ